MAEAISLARENVRSGRGGPFAALVVKDGEVIARGSNQVTATTDPTAHAEVVAIRNACQALASFQLTGCAIYANCEPCPMCLGAIYWARLDAVYYACTQNDAAQIGFDDSFIYSEIKLPIDGRHLRMVHLPSDQAAEVFRLWDQSGEKITY